MREVDVCTSDRLSVEISGTGALIGTSISAHWGASCFFRFVRIRSRAERRQYRGIQRKLIKYKICKFVLLSSSKHSNPLTTVMQGKQHSRT